MNRKDNYIVSAVTESGDRVSIAVREVTILDSSTNKAIVNLYRKKRALQTTDDHRKRRRISSDTEEDDDETEDETEEEEDDDETDDETEEEDDEEDRPDLDDFYIKFPSFYGPYHDSNVVHMHSMPASEPPSESTAFPFFNFNCI